MLIYPLLTALSNLIIQGGRKSNPWFSQYVNFAANFVSHKELEEQYMPSFTPILQMLYESVKGRKDICDLSVSAKQTFLKASSVLLAENTASWSLLRVVRRPGIWCIYPGSSDIIHVRTKDISFSSGVSVASIVIQNTKSIPLVLRLVDTSDRLVHGY